jgi:hypothetical protein
LPASPSGQPMAGYLAPLGSPGRPQSPPRGCGGRSRSVRLGRWAKSARQRRVG